MSELHTFQGFKEHWRISWLSQNWTLVKRIKLVLFLLFEFSTHHSIELWLYSQDTTFYELQDLKHAKITCKSISDQKQFWSDLFQIKSKKLQSALHKYVHILPKCSRVTHNTVCYVQATYSTTQYGIIRMPIDWSTRNIMTLCFLFLSVLL